MPHKKRYTFQRIDSATNERCCVPFCRTASKYNKVLSFHAFPSDTKTRQRWIVAIRRENLTIRPHTRICSRHFIKEDVKEPGSEKGRRVLKKGAVPRLFQWNGYSLSTKQPVKDEKPADTVPVLVPVPIPIPVPKVHNHDSSLDPLPVDEKEQKEKIVTIKIEDPITSHHNSVPEVVTKPTEVGAAMSVSVTCKSEAEPVDITSAPQHKADGKQLKKPLTSLLLAPQLLSGLGQYVCSVCGDTFASLAQLARHVQFHDRDRPFPCAACGKRFLSRSHHDEHQRVHTGERPFPCDRCDRSFTTHHNRKRHQLIHDKEEAYRCTVCGVLFCQEHQLGNLSGIIHVLKQHEKEKPGHVMGIKTKIRLTSMSTDEQEENVRKKKKLKHQHSNFETDYSCFAGDDGRMSFQAEEADVSETSHRAGIRIKKIAYDMEITL